MIEVIRGVAASFESLAVQKGIVYSINIPEEPVIEWVDPDCIKKIISNLLSNAFKFTNKGGAVTLTVQTERLLNERSPHAEPDDDSSLQLIIRIADTGMGIRPDELDKIFLPFYQTERTVTDNLKGTGIGLALVKEIVELNNGQITVTSEPGKGSTFIVNLPLGRKWNNTDSFFGFSEQTEDLVSEIDKNKESQTKDFKKDNEAQARLLIVDDNSDMRNYVKATLENTYIFIEAANGEDGLKKAIDKSPHLIISDVMMPGMDGVEFCRRIKTNWETSHIPVILLTAKASDEDKIEGLETGADDYITKPFNSQELQIRAKNLLEQRKRLREVFSREINITADAVSSNSVDHEFLSRVFTIAEENIFNAGFSSMALAQTPEDSFNQHDPEALSVFYRDDADVIVRNGPVIHGVQSIRKWWRVYFSRLRPL